MWLSRKLTCLKLQDRLVLDQFDGEAFAMSSQPTTDTIGAYEAKTHFSALLEKVEAGGEFTITKHGAPVARLVPIKKELSSTERREVIELWKARSKGLSLGGLKIGDLIHEGRR